MSKDYRVDELNDIFRRMRDADRQNNLRCLRNQLAVANLQGSMFSSAEVNELNRNGLGVDGYRVERIGVGRWFQPQGCALVV